MGACKQEAEWEEVLAASFIASVEECIRECKLYDEDLRSKVKL